MHKHNSSSGFLLPVIIILSLAISVVGITTLSTISSSSALLSDQYYQTVAKEAAQAGVNAAVACVRSGTSTWTPNLRPDTTCSGSSSGGLAYVTKQDNWTSTYDVPAPTGTTPKVITSTGTVTIRTNGGAGAVVRTYMGVVRANLGSSSSTVTVPAKTVTSIAAGDRHACAIANVPGATTPAAYCWGFRWCNQLGDNNTNCTTFNSDQLYPKAVITSGNGAVLAGKSIVKIVAGTSTLNYSRATCAIAYDSNPANAQAYCWGSVPDGSGNPYPHIMPGLAGKTVTDIAVSASNVCVAANSGSVASSRLYCYGIRQSGGNGGVGTAPSAEIATGGALTNKIVTKVAVGYYYGCAIAYPNTGTPDDSRAYCWGINTGGFLGTGSGSGVAATPVAVNTSGSLNGKTITDITANGLYYQDVSYDGTSYYYTDYYYGATCAIGQTPGNASTAAVSCWGTTMYNTTGTSMSHNYAPVLVTNLSGRTALQISGASVNTCALTYATGGDPTDTRIFCWGRNNAGQIGNGTTSNYGTSPTQVSMTAPNSALAGKKVTSVAVGGGHTCATAYTSTPDDSRAYCWGAGAYSGTGTSSAITYPRAVDISLANSNLGPTTVTTTTPGVPLFY